MDEFFFDMHGRVDKLIVAVSFENVLRTEKIEQRQRTHMKEACLYVFVYQGEMIFHDPMACYMENYNNQNLRLRMDCNLIDGDNGKSTSVSDMGCCTPVVSFRPMLTYDSGGSYSQQSKRIFHPLYGNQLGESHENRNAVEEVKHSFGVMHALEDPFAVFLETINIPNIIEILIFKFVYNFSNELLVYRLWSKHI
jgi:hypothetical protein